MARKPSKILTKREAKQLENDREATKLEKEIAKLQKKVDKLRKAKGEVVVEDDSNSEEQLVTIRILPDATSVVQEEQEEQS